MAKKGSVIDRDLGWSQIKAESKKLGKKPYVKIGVQGTSANAVHKGGDGPKKASVVDVATFHEFGVPADTPTNSQTPSSPNTFCKSSKINNLF